jgi:uncharacterized repeat protein (TIGR03803 family)
VKGVLYGTTAEGGTSGYGGTIFEISTSGTESVLHSFGTGTDGSDPKSRLIDVNNTLYGTTYNGGGANNAGTVFKISL